MPASPATEQKRHDNGLHRGRSQRQKVGGTDKKIALGYRQKLLDSRVKKEITLTVELLLPFAGNYVFPEAGLTELPRVIMAFAYSLMNSHPFASVRRDVFVAGSLSYSFVVERDGSLTRFLKKHDTLVPPYLFEDHMRRRRFYSSGEVDVCVLNGEKYR